MDLVRHHISKTHSCLIPYKEFSNWTTKIMSDTSIRFSPGENVNIKFEVPPSINIIDYNKYKKDIELKDDKGTNSQNVSYKRVFVKGFERFGYLLSRDGHKVLVLTLEGHPEYGLTNIDHIFINGFDFFNKEKLTEKQINILISESKYRELILKLPSKDSTPLHFKSVEQEDKYVASLEHHRGGPVFHILKNDLSVVKVDPPKSATKKGK